jgi:hypothetical protein
MPLHMGGDEGGNFYTTGHLKQAAKSHREVKNLFEDFEVLCTAASGATQSAQ